MPTMSPTLAPLETPPPSPTSAPTTPEPSTPVPVRMYVVAQGDTLSSIAAQFGSSVGAIVAANSLASADEIVIGQRLVIP